LSATRTLYVCQACGHQSTKWLGRCPECEGWGSLVEELRAVPAKSSRSRGGALGARVQALGEVEQESVLRFASGVPLLDRVLGGGIVAGAVVLLAGEPGIGKSTLLLQVADALSREGLSTLYASAEESPRQLRLRAERLGAHLRCWWPARRAEPLPRGRGARRRCSWSVKIQALRSGARQPSARSARFGIAPTVCGAGVIQDRLFWWGMSQKRDDRRTKITRHLVDTVLSFEGDTSDAWCGPPGARLEVALFEMHDAGLIPLADASRAAGETAAGAPSPVAYIPGPGDADEVRPVGADQLPAPRRMAVGLTSTAVCWWRCWSASPTRSGRS
jgi:DNA repair protein RadA/Sms